MANGYEHLQSVQQLVMDVLKVRRNHRILGTDEHENVIEHSFSVLMLCWRIIEAVRPPLDTAKVFKYALVHDFTERGVSSDVNTYANKEERESKKVREAAEFEKLRAEFGDFEGLVTALEAYEARADEEALFVWSVDKMQAIILGEMDGWRPYASYGVTYDQFTKKGEEFLAACSPYVRDIFSKVFAGACETYYDRPRG